MCNPDNYSGANVKTAFKKICEGYSFADLDIPNEDKDILKSFMKANAVGKSATQISAETYLSVSLVADLKLIQKRTRRALKEKKLVIVPEPPIAEVLKMRLAGMRWQEIHLKGANYSQRSKIQRFITCTNSSKDFERLRLPENELKEMLKVFKESQKIKI